MVVLGGGGLFLTIEVPLFTALRPVKVSRFISEAETLCEWHRETSRRRWNPRVGRSFTLQGYLAHKKQRPPRTLQ